MKKVILVINEDKRFLSHRRQIGELALANGWDVTVVSKDLGHRKEIEDMGISFVDFPVNLTGMNPREELKTFLFLLKLYKKNPDSIIHLVGLKNMLWGGFASRMVNNRGTLHAVSGMGTLFGEKGSNKMKSALLKAFKFIMKKKNVAILFQNHDDEMEMRNAGALGGARLYFTKGSGVDLTDFPFVPSSSKPDDKVRVIFTGRMLVEKGVEDLVKAANLLRKDYKDKVEFLLCGGLSDNPNALTENDIKSWTDGKYIQWLGHRDDVKELLKDASLICFPSYYREGLPKSLIEASAIGLPIVTTDSVGCRDAVEDGRNGFIVPTHSPEKIAEALKKLIDDEDLRRRMGEESRKMAERDFDVHEVARVHLKIYEDLNNVIR